MAKITEKQLETITQKLEETIVKIVETEAKKSELIAKRTEYERKIEAYKQQEFLDLLAKYSLSLEEAKELIAKNAKKPEEIE